jgi:N6-L-threonylcarbamoyladenine synthase
VRALRRFTVRTVLPAPLAPLDELVDRHAPAVVAASGGVAANRELRRRLAAWGEARGLPVVLPPLALTTDNAAMIARAGQLRAARGDRDDPRSLRAYARAAWKGGADSRGRPVFPPL